MAEGHTLPVIHGEDTRSWAIPMSYPGYSEVTREGLFEMNQLWFMIEGQRVGFYPPSLHSKTVKENLKDMKKDLGILTMITRFGVFPDCLRLARYSATALGDVDTLNKITTMQNRVVEYMLGTSKIMDKVRKTADEILDNLKCGLRNLLFGNEEEAPSCFQDSRHNTDKLKSIIAEHMDRAETEIECIHGTLNRFLNTVFKRHFSTNTDFSEKAESASRGAETALKTLQQLMTSNMYLLDRFVGTINNFGGNNVLKYLERVQTTEESINSILGQKAFQRKLVNYFAKWVALQLLCDEYTQGIEEVEEEIKRQLLEEVPCEREAEGRIDNIAGCLQQKLRDMRERVDMADNREDEFE